MYKIIGADQREYGPASADQIRQWISQGRINAYTKIQAEGTGVWKSAAEFPEFAGSMPPLPPLRVETVPPSTNSLSIWALVLGIFSILCCPTVVGPIILGILSIVLGAVSLSQIKKHPNQSGSGMAIAAIVLGILGALLGVSLIALCVMSPQWLDDLRVQLQQ